MRWSREGSAELFWCSQGQKDRLLSFPSLFWFQWCVSSHFGDGSCGRTEAQRIFTLRGAEHGFVDTYVAFHVLGFVAATNDLL